MLLNVYIMVDCICGVRVFDVFVYVVVFTSILRLENIPLPGQAKSSPLNTVIIYMCSNQC